MERCFCLGFLCGGCCWFDLICLVVVCLTVSYLDGFGFPGWCGIWFALRFTGSVL